jgi:hypothetical protein
MCGQDEEDLCRDVARYLARCTARMQRLLECGSSQHGTLGDADRKLIRLRELRAAQDPAIRI